MDLLARLNDDPLPFAKMLGIRFIEAEPDRLVAELEIRDELCTRGPVAHGGLLMAFADTLGGTAAGLDLPEGVRTTTLESKTNFLAPVPLGTRIVGVATPLHRGRATRVWQTRIETESGRLAALVIQTQLVLAPRA